MHPHKTILAAIDFSSCSVDAHRQVARVAAWSGAELHALQAVNARNARFHGLQHDKHCEGYGGGITGFIDRFRINPAVLVVRSTWNTRDFLMGSTAERVCRDAGCSILTVRPVAETR